MAVGTWIAATERPASRSAVSQSPGYARRSARPGIHAGSRMPDPQQAFSHDPVAGCSVVVLAALADLCRVIAAEDHGGAELDDGADYVLRDAAAIGPVAEILLENDFLPVWPDVTGFDDDARHSACSFISSVAWTCSPYVVSRRQISST